MTSAEVAEKPEIEKVIPTTPSQMEIWLACKLGGKEANKAYNESISVKLEGKLIIKTLQDAFLKVLERHDAMRSVVSPNGKSFLVFSNYSLPIRMRDICGLNSEEKEKYLKKHAEQTGTYDFNLTTGPLYVLDLIKLEEENHLLTFTGHHIVFDGWSLGVMLEELGLIYSDLVCCRDPELPKADRFGEYAQEFYNLTRKSNYRQTKDFWKAYLSDPVPDFVLPADKPLTAGRTYSARRHEIRVQTEVMLKAKAVAAKLGASFNLALLAIFELLLSDWTKRQDVIIGLPVAGQIGLNKPRLIGHCVNLLPLRSLVNRDESFREYLKKRKEDYYMALDYSFISFGEMIKDIKLIRNHSRIPLVPITFNIDSNLGNELNFNGLEHQLILNPKSFSNFEIIFNLLQTSEEFIFEWTYNTELFSKALVEEIALKYSNMISAFVDNPDEKIAHVFEGLANPVLDPTPEVPQFQPLGELLRIKLAAGKNKLGVCAAGKNYSYDELTDKVDAIAVHLLARGVGPGKIVAVHLQRSVDLVASALAVIRIGACYMPIDSEYPEERVLFMLTDVDVKAFITDNQQFSWGKLDAKKVEMGNNIFAHSIPGFQVKLPRPEDPLFIVYTSGSTGTPKGVALSQQNLSDFLIHFAQAPGFQDTDRVLGLSSISFDMSFMELVLPFVYGASLHLLDNYERRDSREIVKILNSGSITKLYATPSHLKSIFDYGLASKLEHLTIISAGEPLQDTLAHTLVKHSGKVFNIYGPTETTIFSNIKEITEETQEITIGKPVLGASILLLDEEGKLITDSGRLGEIYIGGKGVGLGYLNREELNRERFIHNPIATNPGLYYRTGDLAVWTTSGELICKGRMDHQVKIRGQRIELVEIENSIALDSAVEHVIVEKTSSEQGDDELVALLSFKNGKKELDSNEWIAECRDRLRSKLPTYMIPSSFIVVDDFELNQNGKVDRKLARKFIQVGKPFRDTSSVNEVVEAQSPSELVLYLLTLWNKFINVSENQLDSDFFQLGGHSLMAVDLISILEKKFGIALPLSILFEYPTINSLATRLKELTETNISESNMLVKFKEGDPRKVLFFIHGVGLNPIEIRTLNEHMDKDQTIWGLQSPSILSPNCKPLDTIEEIAHLYISEIKKLGYTGPYRLLGNSFGGQIAFEMAKQLLKANEEVKFLGMIDTVASIRKSAMNSFVGNISLLSKKILFEIGFFANDPAYYFPYRIGYIKDKAGKIKKGTDYPSTGVLRTRISQIEKVNMAAWEKYTHEYVDTTLTLFLAEKRTFYVPDFKTFGWSGLVRKINTISMPGDHASMLKPPYGVEFSRVLQGLLNSSK